MSLNRVISVIENLRESPTNNIGDGSIKTYDKLLFPPAEDLLDQDYQTPEESGEAKYRFSNVYPVEKLSLSDIDNMVDASKEYTDMIDDKRLKNIMSMVRSIKEDAAIPTNNASSGNVAGLTGEPPVNLKKRKKPPTIIARGLMPGARKRWSNG